MERSTKFIQEPAGGDTRPVPDPTALTANLIEQQVKCLREIVEARLNGMDSRFTQLHAEFDRIPEETVKGLDHLQELHTEKFRSIDTQFKERDVRTEQTAKDTKVAVDAALQAAEKAVGKQNESFTLATAKSETATMKQIDQISFNVQTMTNVLNGKIDDIKVSMTSLKDDYTRQIGILRDSDSRGVGADNQVASHKADSQSGLIATIMVVGVIVAAIAIVVPIVIHFATRS